MGSTMARQSALLPVESLPYGVQRMYVDMDPACPLNFPASVLPYQRAIEPLVHGFNQDRKAASGVQFRGRILGILSLLSLVLGLASCTITFLLVKQKASIQLPDFLTAELHDTIPFIPSGWPNIAVISIVLMALCLVFFLLCVHATNVSLRTFQKSAHRFSVGLNQVLTPVGIFVSNGPLTTKTTASGSLARPCIVLDFSISVTANPLGFGVRAPAASQMSMSTMPTPSPYSYPSSARDVRVGGAPSQQRKRDSDGDDIYIPYVPKPRT